MKEEKIRGTFSLIVNIGNIRRSLDIEYTAPAGARVEEVKKAFVTQHKLGNPDDFSAGIVWKDNVPLNEFCEQRGIRPEDCFLVISPRVPPLLPRINFGRSSPRFEVESA